MDINWHVVCPKTSRVRAHITHSAYNVNLVARIYIDDKREACHFVAPDVELTMVLYLISTYSRNL